MTGIKLTLIMIILVAGFWVSRNMIADFTSHIDSRVSILENINF